MPRYTVLGTLHTVSWEGQGLHRSQEAVGKISLIPVCWVKLLRTKPSSRQQALGWGTRRMRSRHPRDNNDSPGALPGLLPRQIISILSSVIHEGAWGPQWCSETFIVLQIPAAPTRE